MGKLRHAQLRTALAVFGVLAIVYACRAERAVAPVEMGEIDVGDTFESVLDDEADADSIVAVHKPRLVTVTLHTSTGEVARMVAVEWKVKDGGSVSPLISVTDSLGHARTQWMLGPDSGQTHRMVAVAKGFAPTNVSVLSHSGVATLGRFAPLELATYDGGGETVHPDYVRIHEWRPRGRFIAITPYKGGNSGLENPSVYLSSDLVRWHAPDGATNPVARPTETHLSDPDIVFDPARAELMLYYRQVGSGNSVWLIRSADAVKWTEPVQLVSVSNHELVSPAIVRRSATDWLMWSVNAHSGCGDANADVELRRSTDGLEWSAPEHVTLDQTGGLMPWHIDVQWIPSKREYWALFPAKTARNCTTRALYLATSPDGVTWRTYPSPVISRGADPALADIVYRSTFAYDSSSDIVTLWYSGARYGNMNYIWSTVAERRMRDELFTTIRAKPLVALRSALKDTPPLVNPP